jgi:AraC-like DNA-binding protein
MDEVRRAPLVFSTDAIPAPDRFEAWREMFARALARVDVTTPDRSRFRASATVHLLDALHLIEFELGPMSLSRTRELLKDGDDGFTLVVCTAGRFDAVSASNGRIAVGKGGAALVPHYRVGGTTTGVASSELSLVIPRASLGRAVRDPDRAAGLMPDGAALDLLIGYVRHLGDLAGRLRRDLVPLVEGHILDLLARTYDPAGEWSRSAPHGGVRAAQRRKLLQAIAEEFTDPALSPARLAARLGMSPRYVHLLLEETGRTFTDHVREHRLQAARRMLASPRFLSERVIDIALAVGFSDLSYFNRTFRRRFGDSPQAFRP